ncbi:MAG: hypothetical protein IK126_07390 [Bacteroidales bacterium]|nr:hypothetical protein [Bacteroidales bacterium]
MKAILSFLLVAVLALQPSFAQQDNEGKPDAWFRIEKMISKQRYTDAYTLADSLRTVAMTRAKAGQKGWATSRQLLTSTWYMERAAINYQEDVADSSLSRFRAILPYLNPVDRTLCHIFLGNIDSALVDTVALREVPNLQIADFCAAPKNVSFNTTPTMYDLVMHLAMEYVPQKRRIELQRQLTAWYSTSCPTKGSVNLILYNEIRLINFLVAQPNKSLAYRKRLVQDCLNRCRWTGNEQMAELYDRMAGFCEQDGDYLTALAYCDSAIARWPKSQGGVACANRKRQIETKKIDMSIAEVSPAGRDILMRVETRNVQNLYYRLIKFPEWYKDYYKSDSEIRARLLKERVVKTWSQSFTLPKDYKFYKHYGYIPGLAPGRYLLMASPTKDFTSEGFCAKGFTVSAAVFVIMSSPEDSVYGYVVDYGTGGPVAGQKVQLQRSKNYYNAKYGTVATATTDAQGFFAFGAEGVKDRFEFDWRLVTQYKGLEVVSNCSIGPNERDTVRDATEMFLDRPVYRPGDTVQFMLVEGRVEFNRTGHAVVGDRLQLLLYDVNYKTIDTLYGTTDAYGSLSGRFVIPAHALPGQFVIRAYQANFDNRDRVVCMKSFPVEAYKQPKFTVTLKGVDRKDAEGHSVAPSLGDSLVVEGLAASYTQVPVSGAKVVYSVTRSMMRPWWRRWFGNSLYSEVVTLVSDSLVTDAEGQFRIAFVAEPDSNIELSTKPCFTYEVRVDVTDINGETHSQSLTLNAGYDNSYISITLPEQLQELANVEYKYCDINGTPLKGYVALSVERLRQPERPLLSHSQLLAGVRHTISREEFDKRFPLTAYTREEENMWNWPVEKRVFDTRVKCEGLTLNRVPMPMLEPGVYRLRMATDEHGKRTVVDTLVVVYTPKGSTKVYTMDLLWSDISTESARVGDTVVLRFGTRHKDVHVAYEMVCGDKTVQRRLLHVDNEIATLRIPVSEALLGGFDVNLCAVKEGRFEREHYRVEVPFEHKKLDVQIVTFRDKLTPGEKERWTIKIEKSKSENYPDASANSQSSILNSQFALLLGMYDAALDNYGFGGNSFAWFPWHNTESNTAVGLSYYLDWRYREGYDLLIPHGKYTSFQGKRPGGWNFTALNHRGWRWRNSLSMPGTQVESIVASVGGVGYATARGESGMVTRNGAVGKRAAVKNAAVLEPEVTTDLEVVEDVMVMEEAAVMYAVEPSAKTRSVAEEKPYVRTNLSTLAFFEPTLRADRDGTVSYSFTAPDLLTQWNVKGLAWTQELATGSLERQLITRKELMIQPNMPRFLREGDTATLMAKVMNLTDSDLTVEVEFSFEIVNSKLKIENSADKRNNSQFSILNSQIITVPARGTMPVQFTVTVPVGGTVATYKYVATAARHSDGEQGPLPLLTNRQAVTQSVSMYMNGKGTKQYSMSLPASTTAQPVSFTVEYTANPIWLAIQSLPFMKECSNPSNIYLFNSYYVNTIGKTIAEQFPQLKHCADQAMLGDNKTATEANSPLLRNEDIKQTLLDETPWLRSGLSEVEQLKNIARFYDSESLEQQCKEAFDKLQKEQRYDGGWPWMPGGRHSSTYVTQHILKGYGMMARQMSRGITSMETRALAYVDKEAYKDYLDWQKYLAKHPDSKCKPIMLDYLYTRSYYAGCSFDGNAKQAFDYFYGNAKQRYGDYTSLYDQALLALVFQRNGDTKLAREIVERIRQKALYSDEMGMYWRDNKAGWFYYQRPVETQALLIETFREVTPQDTHSVGQMQQWLLKQKQTTRWSSDIATLRAIQALMPVGTKKFSPALVPDDNIIVRGKALVDTLQVDVAGSSAGYLRHTYRADSLASLTAGRNVSTTIVRDVKGISWGALYYQYTEQMDKIPASETGITLTRTLYKVEADGSLTELKKGRGVAVGDRLRVRLNVQCDRNMEYVELKEFRAACLEPVSTASGWVWTNGLSYYVAINNSHNAVYIDRLEKGKYIIDTDYYVTNPGTFTLAPSVLQCLYAPEFRATSPGQRITVK